MFKRTLRRLTALNAGVFGLIFIVFGMVLYAFVAHQLFDDVDQSMREKAEAFRLVSGRPKLVITPPVFLDPRIFILLRDTEGKIINFYPYPSEDRDNIADFLSRVKRGSLESRWIENHVYRVLSIPYNYSDNKFIKPDNSVITINEVIAVSIVDSEVAMLRRLLGIIVISLISGVLVIAAASYYLAHRAIIPITASWEKQQQFVADASHELRTPLTVIKSNAELLLRRPTNTIEQESPRIATILRETSRMTKLVANLLTLARADADHMELHPALIDLSEVVRLIAEQFKPLAEAKGINVNMEIEDNITIVADKERVFQLLVILLDNALKYTATGFIKLVCRRQTLGVLIQVQDSGAGIPTADLQKIFDRFFRGDKARSRETGGAGLGLAIAKWIVEKHGGKINVESQVGTGTCFSITLPGIT
jgi:signal transduction histidine kinase